MMQDKNFDILVKKVLRDEIDGQHISSDAKNRIRTNLGLDQQTLKTTRYT